MKFGESLVELYHALGRVVGKSQPIVRELPVLQFDMAGAGPQNVHVPVVAQRPKKEPHTMADGDKDKDKDKDKGLTLENLNEKITGIADTVNKLAKAMSKNQDPDDKDKNSLDADGDGKDTTKGKMKPPTSTTSGDPATMGTYGDVLKLRCEMRIQNLRMEGFRVTAEAEKAVVTELMTCADDDARDTKIAAYKTMLPRNPVNGYQTFAADQVVPAGAEPSKFETMDKVQSDAFCFSIRDQALKKAAVDGSDPVVIYEQMMDEALAKDGVAA